MDRARLIELFLVEARQHLSAAFAALDRLESGATDAGLRGDLMRRAHSLKGMAATLELREMVELAHAMEDLFDAPDGPDDPAAPMPLPRIADALLLIQRMVDEIEAGRSAHFPESAELVRALRGMPAEVPESEIGGCWRLRVRPAPGDGSPAARTVRLLRRLRTLGPLIHVLPIDVRNGRDDGELRVVLGYPRDAEALERALERMEEVGSFELRAEPRAGRRADERTAPAGWVRVRSELVDVGVRSAQDLMLVQNRLATPVGDRRARELDRSRLLSRQLFSLLNEMRLEPFASIVPRLRLCCRETARELGKAVRLEIEGEEEALDRRRLDALVDPLQHLIRNAVDHGLESEPERLAEGKPPTGRLRLSLRRGSHRVRIRVEDDGRGMDPERLRRTAVRRGLLEPSAAATLSDEHSLALTMLPGFSTAETVSEISGRGIGMDVVRSEIEGLSGRVRLRSAPGRGTTVDIDLPASAALLSVLLVRDAGDLYALRGTTIEGIVEGGPAGVDAVGLSASLAGRAGPESVDRKSLAIDVRTDRGILRVGVDALVGYRELIVEPLEPPLARLAAFGGAALLQNGSIALVVDPNGLVGEGLSRTDGRAEERDAEVSPGGAASSPGSSPSEPRR